MLTVDFNNRIMDSYILLKTQSIHIYAHIHTHIYTVCMQTKIKKQLSNKNGKNQ